MPKEFSQVHIVLTAVTIALSVAFALWTVLGGKARFFGKKAVAVTFFTLSAVTVLIAVCFGIASVFKFVSVGGYGVNGDFAVVSGKFTYSVPFFSEAFKAISSYEFFAAICALAVALAVTGTVTQSVRSSKRKAAKIKAEREAERAKAEQTEKLSREKEQERRFSAPGVCTLGNKRIIKSNAAALYAEYLEDRRKDEDAKSQTI
ncbi:MAG: hypothetical protein ACI4SC_01040 [Candidatus Neoclostridium sp.]